MILYSHSKNFILIALMAASLDLKANRRTDDGYFDCPCPLILAHQGAANDLPGNTVEAFQLAFDQGANIIELDIWRTKDNVWAVVHDRNLERITGTDRNVNELTFQEIQSLDAGYTFQNSEGKFPYRGKNFKIPSLEAVFRNFNHNRINIEIKEKSVGGLNDLIRLINAYNMNNKVLVVSRSYRVISRFRSLTRNKIPTGASFIDAIKSRLFGQVSEYEFLIKPPNCRIITG